MQSQTFGRRLWKFIASRVAHVVTPAGVAVLAASVLAAVLMMPDASAQQKNATSPKPAATTAAAAPSGAAPTRTMIGWGIFQQTCLACHGKPEYKQAPSPATLRTYSPERIYDALTTGPMKAVGAKFTDTQKRLVADAVSGRSIGSTAKGDAKDMPNRCVSNPPMSDPAAGPSWNGWGNNIHNTRFQPAKAAGLRASEVPKLKLKWAFGIPNAINSYSQPTVVSGRVFFGTDTGYVYSLNAKTGCVYWSYSAAGGVRNALTIEPVTIAGERHYVAFFGDLRANMYAVDAQTGKLIWKTAADPEYYSRITAPPAYYDGKLFVPISSWEEFSARTLTYSCCTSVGSVVALNARTGKHLWQSYVIKERPKPTRKNSMGVQQYAPAGGAVWNTPAVDPKLHAIYVGSGDGTTYPAPDTVDALLAMDMDTGKILWSYQSATGDSFLVGCRGKDATDNCPKVEGPDWDIPVSPVLVTLRNGKRLVITATKPGDVFAVDPDRHGKLVWRVNATSDKLAIDMPQPQARRLPGMMWGGGVYDGAIYYGLNRGGGVVALRLTDGKRLWRVRLPGGPKSAHATPATAMPGVIFLGGMDGRLYALSSRNGKVLWRYNTNRAFDAVNKVAAHGGAMSSQGVTVVGGMVFVGSGYGRASNAPGNVVLAFAPN